MKALGIGPEDNPQSAEVGYQFEFQLTSKGELYNLSEAAAWLAESRQDMTQEFQPSKTNVIVLNDSKPLRPWLYKQHIPKSEVFGNSEKGKLLLKEEIDCLKCVQWANTPMPPNWDRQSTVNVSYFSKAKLKIIAQHLESQLKQNENYIIIWPEI